MTLESGLLLLVVLVVAIAFYCLQRTLLETLRILWRINVRAFNATLFLKPDTKLEQKESPRAN